MFHRNYSKLQEEMMRKYLSELVGTLLVVFAGCGSAVAAGALFSALGITLPAAFTTLAIAMAFGLATMAVYYMIGNVSGGHINPAVSLGMLITRKLSVKDFIGYIIAQFAGGIAGAGLLAYCISGTTSLAANGYGDSSTFGISSTVAFVMEAVLTFALVSTFINVTSDEKTKGVAGIVIGFAVTAFYGLAVPFTGGSLNPARSLGPALLQGSTAISQVWVFIAAPLVGGVLAALFYMLIHGGSKAVAEEQETEQIEAAAAALIGEAVAEAEADVAEAEADAEEAEADIAEAEAEAEVIDEALEGEPEEK